MPILVAVVDLLFTAGQSTVYISLATRCVSNYLQKTELLGYEYGETKYRQWNMALGGGRLKEHLVGSVLHQKRAEAEGRQTKDLHVETS